MSDLSNQTPADTYKGLLQVNDYTDGVAGNTGSNALVIQDGAGNATALAVSTDSVGIGTTSPDAALHIVGTPSSTLILERDSTDITAISSIILKDGSDDQVRISSTDSKFLFGTGASNTTRMIIDSDGDVGIGTESPDGKLSVVNDGAEGVEIQPGLSAGLNRITNFNRTTNSYNQLAIDASDTFFRSSGTNMIKIESGIISVNPNNEDHDFNVRSDIGEGLFVQGSNGNVGIGTTSPSEKLHVSGDAIITGDLNVSGTTTTVNTQTLTVEDHQIILGTLSTGTPTDLTANNGGIILKGDTDKTILWSNTADAWRCNQNFIADGNVGIGTTSPSRTLDIVDATNDGSGGLKIQNYKPVIELSDSTASATATTLTQDNTKFTIANDSVDSLTIDSDGNVGIGTDSPDAPLHIVGSPASTLILERDSTDVTAISSVVLKDGSDDQVRISSTNSKLRLETGSGNDVRMLIDSDGNVGIGTDDPTASLECQGPGQSVALFKSKSTVAGAMTMIAIESPSATSNGRTRIGADVDDMFFSTSNGTSNPDSSVERMRIDSAGNVGIGTTSPDYKLDVQESTNGTYAAKIFNNGGDSYGLLVKTSSGIDEDFPILDLENTAGNVFRVQADGNVGIGTTSPAANHKLHIKNTETANFRLERNKAGHTNAQNGYLQITAAESSNLIYSKDLDGNGKDFVIDGGNVGIGTTSPGAKLEVKGTQNWIASTGDRMAYLSPTVDGGALIILDSSSNEGLRLEARPGEDSFINNGGNVGIGTESPTAKISTQVASGGSYFIDVKGTSNKQWGLKYTQASWLQSSFSIDEFNSIGTAYPRLTIADGGKVGIGTTDPGAKLHIKTSNTTDTLLLEATSDVGLNAPDLVLYRNSASPAADDKIGVVKFRGQHSGGGTKDYANIQGIIVNPTNTAEESKIDFEVRRDGDLESRMEVGPDKVEVSSTTGGVVMPRMTTTQRTDIASPSNGEMVYDTDLNKFYGYANNTWTPLH